MKFFKGRLLLFLTSLGILTAGAQNYAYLNASGGNMGQSATGADTSIYLFHENRIEKLDKNLNPLWANSYSNLTFNNILLSKSGKIFFIGAQDKVGMINPDGTIGWVTALNGSSVTGSSTLTALSNVNNKHLQLDRNGDLILTGGMGVYGFMIKLDTSGAFKKMRVFHFQSPSPSANMNNMAVISDSLGEYKLYADHHVSLSSSITQYVLNYSETSDVVTGMKTFNVGDGGSFSAPVTFFYKSRFGNNFYIGVSVPKNTFNTY
ncbi:MAG: hypothetical protein K0S12_1253, partial [Bacteroidetes bacterium]|nr:hypothetical protein [Bacteroidota bacterium]